jgi:pyrroloquinoline quinone biosynthesis protein E
MLLDGFRPYTLIAELTYRCPLSCGYCSNPVDLAAHARRLDASLWVRAFGEAAALGVVQLHLTGGEPLLYPELEWLVAAARAAGLYTQLVTSGVPLERDRLAVLQAGGLDAVQLSFQAADAETNDRLAGRTVYAHKLAVARWVKELDLPLTINVVLHRHNLDQVADLVALAEALGADRLELANTQYLGWALAHRDALMPARAQLEQARAVAKAARARLRGQMELLFVTPDYYADAPRACMEGWARRYLVISPDGRVLPCQAAHELPGLAFERVGDRPLAEIWAHSEALNRFRGDDGLPEACKGCERRHVDFGGCRCQAFRLTGDVMAVDPACRLSPVHGLVEAARERAEAGEVEGGSVIPYRRLARR